MLAFFQLYYLNLASTVPQKEKKKGQSCVHRSANMLQGFILIQHIPPLPLIIVNLENVCLHQAVNVKVLLWVCPFQTSAIPLDILIFKKEKRKKKKISGPNITIAHQFLPLYGFKNGIYYKHHLSLFGLVVFIIGVPVELNSQAMHAYPPRVV